MIIQNNKKPPAIKRRSNYDGEKHMEFLDWTASYWNKCLQREAQNGAFVWLKKRGKLAVENT